MSSILTNFNLCILILANRITRLSSAAELNHARKITRLFLLFFLAKRITGLDLSSVTDLGPKNMCWLGYLESEIESDIRILFCVNFIEKRLM